MRQLSASTGDCHRAPPRSVSLRVWCGNSHFQGLPHSAALYGVQNLPGPNCEKSNEAGFCVVAMPAIALGMTKVLVRQYRSSPN
jgi:hypothetical protein